MSNTFSIKFLLSFKNNKYHLSDTILNILNNYKQTNHKPQTNGFENSDKKQINKCDKYNDKFNNKKQINGFKKLGINSDKKLGINSDKKQKKNNNDKSRIQLIKPINKDLIIILNKFSEDNFDNTLKQLIIIITKLTNVNVTIDDNDNVELTNCITFLITNIFKNNLMIELYTTLWINIFKKIPITKTIYLKHCLYLFENKFYNTFDALSQSLFHLYKHKVIKISVIDNLLCLLLEKILNLNDKEIKCLCNLLFIPKKRLKTIIKQLNITKNDILIFVNNQPANKEFEKDFVYVSNKLIQTLNYSDIIFIINNIIISKISANIIKNSSHIHLTHFINKIIQDIFTHEYIIDIILIILSHEQNLQNIQSKPNGNKLITLLINHCKNKPNTLTPKWKFKFMDFQDLYNKQNNPKQHNKTKN